MFLPAMEDWFDFSNFNLRLTITSTESKQLQQQVVEIGRTNRFKLQRDNRNNHVQGKKIQKIEIQYLRLFFLSRATEIFCMVQNGIRFVKNTLNTFPLKSVYIDKSCPRKKSHSRTRSTLSEPAFQHFLTTSDESLTWQTKILLP